MLGQWYMDPRKILINGVPPTFPHAENNEMDRKLDHLKGSSGVTIRSSPVQRVLGKA